MPILLSHYFVRVGILGQIGRFRASDGQRYRRGMDVICRTQRGLETGVVLTGTSTNSPLAEAPLIANSPDGSIVRRQTTTDRLLLTRLEKNRHQAYRACVELLAQHGHQATLMDVEQLFDGRSLYFYFLGDVPAAVDRLTAQLAEAYDANVQFRAFADAVEQGCGPDCGTEEAGGCGSNCQSCAVAAACAKG